MKRHNGIELLEGVGDLEFVEDDVTGRIEVMGRIGGEERGQGRDGGFESEDKQHVVPYVQVDKSPSSILFPAVAHLLPLGSSVGNASVSLCSSSVPAAGIQTDIATDPTILLGQHD